MNQENKNNKIEETNDRINNNSINKNNKNNEIIQKDFKGIKSLIESKTINFDNNKHNKDLE